MRRSTEKVCLWGKIGSHQQGVKTALLTQLGHARGETSSLVAKWGRQQSAGGRLWNPAGQRGGLLHPIRHLRLVELVAL